MKPEEAAFINLVALARADGEISSSEESLLERYREALHLTEEFAAATLEKTDLTPLRAGEIEGKPTDRMQIVKMMIRMAYADGRIAGAEKLLIARLAASFNVGRIALKGLYWEIERELGIKRKLRLSQVVAVVTVVVAVIVIWITFRHFQEESRQQIDEANINLDQIKSELGLEKAKAEEALRKVEASQRELAQKEEELEQRLLELDRRSADERASLKTAVTAEQESQRSRLDKEVRILKDALARARSVNTRFKEVEKEYGASILLIFITYDLVSGNKRLTRGSMGSGFFVTSTGYIVTNKHVVQPWKYSGDDILFMDNGFAIDPDSMLVAAWTAGSEMKTAGGDLHIDTAFSNIAGTLAVANTTPDLFESQPGFLESGAIYESMYHVSGVSDLAVLKAVSATPVKALPLNAVPGSLEKLDPVMVLGFPTGINILETTRAETSPSLGEVRKIETNIMVTAPIFPGNSGGPLIDLEGSAVGVAARIYGESTLGVCIPASHIFALLPTAAELLDGAERFEAERNYGAALDDLRLAEQRSHDEKVRSRIRERVRGLIRIRDDMMARAENESDASVKDAAYEEIVTLFGAHWARAASVKLNDS